MKKLILFAAAVLCMGFVQSEKYYVTFVKGAVIVVSTGKALKVGDVLQPADQVIFKDKDAKLSCISPGKGRFDLSGRNAKSNAGGELLAILKSSLVKSSSSYQLSTRSLMFEGYDPKTYFSSAETSDRILLIKDHVIPIVPSYTRDERNFFFLQYDDNGKPITRKIKQNSSGILFNDELFTVGTKVHIPQKVMLCYQTYTSDVARSTVLVEFTPVLATPLEIQQQINLIAKNSGITDQKKLNNEIIAHLFDNYGKIGAGDIGALMEGQSVR